MARIAAVPSGAARVRLDGMGLLGLADLEITRRGRFVLWSAAALLMVSALFLGGRAVAGAPVPATEVVPYTVAQGETLWAIASDVAHPGEDLRDVVSLIIDLNGRTTAELDAGEQILVPQR